MIFSNKTTNKSIRSLWKWALILVASCVFSIEASAADSLSQKPKASAETKLTAIFLYQFSKFIKWPTDTNTDQNASYFTICVDDDLPLQTILEKITAGEMVGNLPIAIRKLHEIPNSKQCQMIYFSSANEANFNLLASIEGQPTLTVTSNQEMLYYGAMIRLKKQGKRIRPQVNLELIKQT
ncbi:MAG: YfiR family protein, partial [Pseudomonadales bacterium]|nr:YfiR family protein [Pseudomonadales bacterium]